MILFEQEPWPVLFELEAGASVQVLGHTVTLCGVSHQTQPDWWIEDNPGHRIVSGARVAVEVDGESGNLHMRPYQMPETVGPLRLCVEATGDSGGGLYPVQHLRGPVRLSARPAGQAWGPEMSFPLPAYRWRANTYYNTWGALVPYNHLYYHRGEDFGAIPDCLEVVSLFDGEVSASPLPHGDGASNGLCITTCGGVTLRYAHMNTDGIEAAMATGANVMRGQRVGLTGMTWSGRKSQHYDPHLHLGITVPLRNGETAINTYPHIVEAYLRDFEDPLLPVAGGYHFAEPGTVVELDGSRSIGRPDAPVASMTWHLHDGRTIEGAVAKVCYQQPGLYSEKLRVRNGKGDEDCDFAQVRVFDPARGRDIARGWAYHWPLRAIQAGQEVLFWNRLRNTRGPVLIDFGEEETDARIIEDQLSHRYRKAGTYIVSLKSRGPDDEPVTLCMRLHISD